MNNTLLIFLIIALFIIITLGILIVVFFINKEKKLHKEQQSKGNANKINNINDFISKAESAINASQIQELILQFLNSQKLSNNANNSDTKRKLEFVSSISANANSSPKNISFLSNELKKRYKTLKKEIDAYEQMGLAKRKMRQS